MINYSQNECVDVKTEINTNMKKRFLLFVS